MLWGARCQCLRTSLAAICSCCSSLAAMGACGSSVADILRLKVRSNTNRSELQQRCSIECDGDAKGRAFNAPTKAGLDWLASGTEIGLFYAMGRNVLPTLHGIVLKEHIKCALMLKDNSQ